MADVTSLLTGHVTLGNSNPFTELCFLCLQRGTQNSSYLAWLLETETTKSDHKVSPWETFAVFTVIIGF